MIVAAQLIGGKTPEQGRLLNQKLTIFIKPKGRYFAPQ
jgi:hypothetical protein